VRRHDPARVGRGGEPLAVLRLPLALGLLGLRRTAAVTAVLVMTWVADARAALARRSPSEQDPDHLIAVTGTVRCGVLGKQATVTSFQHSHLTHTHLR
jgi:hypothetical protein